MNLPLLILSPPFFRAGSADTLTTRSQVEIDATEGMSLGAEGLLAVGIIAATRVLSRGDQLKMRCICAGPIATEMIWLQAARNWPHENKAGMAVSQNRFACINHAALDFPTAADVEDAITTWISGCCPLPAWAEVRTVRRDGAKPNLRPEAGGESIVAEEGGGKLGLHRKATPFGVTRLAVFGGAAALFSGSL